MSKNHINPEDGIGINETSEIAVSEAETVKSSKFRIKLPSFIMKLTKIGKRNVIIGLSVVVIGFAIYLNWMIFSGGSTGGGNSDGLLSDEPGINSVIEDDMNADSYFVNSLISRRRARDEAIEVLQMVAGNDDTLQELKDKALTDINRIAAEIESESNIESLIVAKGFKECVTVINNQNANIIVKSSGLMPNEVSQIKEIVYEQAGILPINIKIIEKN